MSKKKKIFSIKQLAVVVISVVLTTVGIKASDNFFKSDVQMENGCPIDMAYIASETGGFCIDKYEASPSAKCININVVNQADTRVNLSDPICAPISELGKNPWRFISQNQAATACARAGKRLPTNKEWMKAVLGTPDLESNWGVNDCQVNNNWSSQPGLTGFGKNCVSAAGVYDMIGNVWEWVEGVVNEGVYEGEVLPAEGYVSGVDSNGLPVKTNQEQPDPNYYNDYFWIKNKGTKAIARGGYWSNGSDAGQYSLYIVSDPSFAGTGVGFRCVK